MKTFIQSIFGMLLLVLPGCAKDTDIKHYLDAIAQTTYYSEEIIPTAYLPIYGQWRLYEISGGLSGTGAEHGCEYLEIKRIGIYGFIKNDSLIEYGKIEIDTFDTNTTGYLQIKLVPEFYSGQNPYTYPLEKYITLSGNDSLNMFSPCCDMYDYHYRRAK